MGALIPKASVYLYNHEFFQLYYLALWPNVRLYMYNIIQYLL